MRKQFLNIVTCHPLIQQSKVFQLNCLCNQKFKKKLEASLITMTKLSKDAINCQFSRSCTLAPRARQSLRTIPGRGWKDKRREGWLGKTNEKIMVLKITKLISLQWSPYHFISGPKNVLMVNHKRPRLHMWVRWNLNFIKECTKRNKMRSKLYPWKKKFTIKMTQLVFVLCVLRSVRF